MGRCGDRVPRAILSLTWLSELGSLGVMDMGAQAHIFYKLHRCGDITFFREQRGGADSRAYDRQLGKKAREKLCTDELARGQVGAQPTCVSTKVGLGLSMSGLAGPPPGAVDVGAGSLSVGGNPGDCGVLSSISGPTHLMPGCSAEQEAPICRNRYHFQNF